MVNILLVSINNIKKIPISEFCDEHFTVHGGF
jgi:hypothetical protein